MAKKNQNKFEELIGYVHQSFPLDGRIFGVTDLCHQLSVKMLTYHELPARLQLPLRNFRTLPQDARRKHVADFLDRYMSKPMEDRRLARAMHHCGIAPKGMPLAKAAWTAFPAIFANASKKSEPAEPFEVADVIARLVKSYAAYLTLQMRKAARRKRFEKAARPKPGVRVTRTPKQKQQKAAQ